MIGIITQLGTILLHNLTRALEPNRRRFHAITEILAWHNTTPYLDKIDIFHSDTIAGTRATTLQTTHHIRQRGPLPITDRYIVDIEFASIAISAIAFVIRALRYRKHASSSIEVEVLEGEVGSEP